MCQLILTISFLFLESAPIPAAFQQDFTLSWKEKPGFGPSPRTAFPPCEFIDNFNSRGKSPVRI